MFERYTEGARRVLFFSRYEASQSGSLSIEAEHILLGLLRERGGPTNWMFACAQISVDGLRAEIRRRIVSADKHSTSVEIPFSAETKRVLQFAAEESDRLRHDYIGTEHLLLGILREERSLAATIAREKGMQLDSARDAIVEMRNAKQKNQPEHIVLVQVTVKPEMLEEFERALLHNARESVERDPGCLRFDVSQSADDPSRWVLHEVYTNADAHAVHRQSPHFRAYDEVASRAVVAKDVVRGTGKHIT